MRLLFLGLIAAGLACAQQRAVIQADIEEGARNFGNFCAFCHGPDGNAMPDADLSKPTLKRASTDEQITAIMLSGIPGTGMPPNNLNQRQVFTIVAYIRSLSKAPPRPISATVASRGQAVFEGKGGCLGCHRVRDKGSYTGPNLSDIGLLRRAAELEKSIVDPAAEVLAVNSTVVAATKSGETIRGRMLNADTHVVQIMDSSGKLRSVYRDTLGSFTQELKSPMPSYKDRLTRDELTDLVAYLVSLRGF
jgi:putative heme-binding domain-containing protein